MQHSLGIDPGLAYTGLSGVRITPEGAFVSAGVQLIRSMKDNTLPRARDDLRRHTEIAQAIEAALQTLGPMCLGVETYTIRETQNYDRLRRQAQQLIQFLSAGKHSTLAAFQQALFAPHTFLQFLGHVEALRLSVDAFRSTKGRGNAAKTYGVYVAACYLAVRAGVAVQAMQPADVKRWATGQPGASKEAVRDAVRARVSGIEAAVAAKKIPPSLEEHVYDATALACMALERQRSNPNCASAQGA